MFYFLLLILKKNTQFTAILKVIKSATENNFTYLWRPKIGKQSSTSFINVVYSLAKEFGQLRIEIQKFTGVKLSDFNISNGCVYAVSLEPEHVFDWYHVEYITINKLHIY